MSNEDRFIFEVQREKAFIRQEMYNDFPMFSKLMHEPMSLEQAVMLEFDKERAEKSILLKGDVFRLANVGQLILNNEETQEINPQTLTFKL